MPGRYACIAGTTRGIGHASSDAYSPCHVIFWEMLVFEPDGIYIARCKYGWETIVTI
jgi:hypothetical protein